MAQVSVKFVGQPGPAAPGSAMAAGAGSAAASAIPEGVGAPPPASGAIPQSDPYAALGDIVVPPAGSPGLGAAYQDPYGGDTTVDPNADTSSITGQYGSGANEQVAGLLDAPGKLANLATNAVGLGTPFKPIFSSWGYKAGLIAPPGTDYAGQIARAAGGMTAGGLMAMLGLKGANAAMPEAEATAAGAPAEGEIATMTRPAGPVSPGRNLVQTMANQSPVTASILASQAGAGGKIGQIKLGQIGQQNPWMGGLIGHPTPEGGRFVGEQLGSAAGTMIGGGVAPITPIGAAEAAAPQIGGRIKTALQLTTEKGQQDLSAAIASQSLKPALKNPNVVKGLQDTQPTVAAVNEGVEGDAPRFTPSLGERSGSASLLAEQRQLEGGASGQRLEQHSQRDVANQQAIANYAEAQTPEGGPLTHIFQAAKSGVAQVSALTEKAWQQLRTQLPGLKAEKAGTVLQGRLDALKKAVSAQFAQRADALGLNDKPTGYTTINVLGHDVPVPMPDNFWHELPIKVSGMGELVADYGPRAKGIMDTLLQNEARAGQGLAPINIPFQDLKYLRERLSSSITDALSGTAPNRALAMNLVKSKAKIDTIMKSYDQGPEYQKFIRDYFDQYVARFEDGGAFKVNQINGRGFLQTQPEKVAGLFTDGSYTNAMQYKTAFGNDPRAMVALKASLLDDFRGKVLKADGTLDPTKAAQWMQSHDGFFRVWPELALKPGDLMTRARELTHLSQAAQDNWLGSEIQDLAKETTTPERVLAAAQTNPKLAQKMTALANGNPDAKMALRRFLFQNAPMDKTLEDYLKNPLVTANLSPSHIQALRVIFDAKNMLARSASMRGSAQTPGVGAALQSQIGMSAGSIMGKYYNVARGVVSPRVILTDGAVRVFDKLQLNQGRELMENALWDEDLAKQIAGMVRSPGPRANPFIKLRPWLVYYGLVAPLSGQPVGPNMYRGGRWQ